MEFEIETRGTKDGEKVTRNYKIQAPDEHRAAEWVDIQAKALKWDVVKILSIKPVELEKKAAPTQEPPKKVITTKKRIRTPRNIKK